MLTFKLIALILCLRSCSANISENVDEPPEKKSTTTLSSTTTGRPLTAKFVRPLVDVFGRRFISAIEAARHLQASQLTDEQLLVKKYQDFADDVTSSTSEIITSLMPIAIEALKDVEISDQCAVALIETTKAIKQQRTWALKMIDANGGIPSGLLSGAYADFGNYEQCLSVSASIDNDLDSLKDDVDEGREDSERVAFQGKYCLLTFGAQLSTSSPHERSPFIVEVGGGQTKPMMDFSVMFKNTSAEGTVRKFPSFACKRKFSHIQQT